MSIFEDKKEDANHLCNFRFLHNKITPKIIQSQPSSVFIYKLPQISIDCYGEQIIYQGCNLCIMKLPCFCPLATQTLSYPTPYVNIL